MHNKSKKLTVLALVTSMVGGCAVPPQQGNMNRQASSQGSYQQPSNEDPCSVGRSALAGAAVGALLGGLTKGRKGALQGAAAGGVIGGLGCVAVNAQSRQTRTAAQVDRDFIQARGRLPAEPQVVAYTPTVGSYTVQRGQPVQVKSVVELVNGSERSVTQVSEEIEVYDLHGERIQNGSKPLTNSTGGRFENSFQVTLPQSASQGVYAMKTKLYVNGKLSASRDLQTQLVLNEHGAVMLASR